MKDITLQVHLHLNYLQFYNFTYRLFNYFQFCNTASLSVVFRLANDHLPLRLNPPSASPFMVEHWRHLHQIQCSTKCLSIYCTYVGAGALLGTYEDNRFKSESKKLPALKWITIGVIVLIDLVASVNVGSKLISPPKTERCSGAGKVANLPLLIEECFHHYKVDYFWA
ncbi:hypothetical protein LXL04_023248 [Taraxacum kok-saghyz]